MKLLTAQLLMAVGLGTGVHAEKFLHLPFDNHPRDLSRGEHHATVSGDVTFDRENFQLGGGAARFSGVTNSFFSIPVYAPSIGNAARSVSFWIRGAELRGNSPNVVFLGWGDAGLLPGTRFDVGLEDGDPERLRIEFNSGRFLVSQTRVPSLGDGEWHHLLVSYDGTWLSFLVDGHLVEPPRRIEPKLATGASAAGMVVGTGVREVAGSAPFNRSFSGLMDDVSVWNSALSEVDAALLNGLGRIGDNDARWLEPAQELWRKPVGTTRRTNGLTWCKVEKLSGSPGDWVRIGGPNGAGSFVVLDAFGRGLQIQPQWWDGLFVRFGILTTGILGLAAAVFWGTDRLCIRLKMRRLEAKEEAERERRRIAQDLHDDLGSGLTEIMSLGDLAEEECRSPEELKTRLADITRKTRELVGAVDEIVWTANPVNDSIPKLAGYLCDYAERFLRAKGIRCRLDVAEGLPEVQVNAKARHHILMAVKEALNNAVKHSGATEVWLRVRCEADELHVAVEDNGSGFNPATVSQGNGLTNLRTRLEELGGRTEIETQPGQGTRIKFRLSLNRAS